ncbi:glycoside hydrolase family 32 protein [Tessaracoccus flavus]|uniref:glycoside hydrolase family 32 protein n=1 Tax=Tessaracoccus flavus TaxID=1610493 RepID=UPI0008973477|nr:glycoside hydrolase family 32 protein [Tessaracoccus flavus]SDY92281.1 levanase [Tessaracoccus flavus]
MLRRLLRASLGLAVAIGAAAVPAAADLNLGEEPYRPAYHYSPETNWMNDPNGLVYHDGVYHLYYQYNPQAATWGNMSWGHATSPDLVNWVEQPLAIGQTFNDAGQSIEDIFSGSIVVDTENTSGLGTADNPPLVAHYTSAYTGDHPTLAGIQAQSVAYSLDGGYTWEKYEGNPVLDRGSNNFRDPKVFRYTSPETGESYWVMVTVEALAHEVLIYRSDDLLHWSYLSTFGPANATGGIWEVPDLFPLPVEGADETKWVMIVNLNPGSPAGGSGAQYFVGEFDGETFTAENVVTGEETVPGTVIEDFEFGSWAESDWTVVNESGDFNGPFGDGPQAGAWRDQQEVAGYRGDSLVNSFVGWDWPTGTMTSAPFEVEQPWLNLLVGGGNHPRVEGGQMGNEPPAGSLLWNGFEGLRDGSSLADIGWVGTGDLQATRSPSSAGGDYYIGDARINTWEGGPNGDDNKGTLTSPSFEISGDYISFLIGGGHERPGLALELIVDGDVVRTAAGQDAGALQWTTWDVAEFRGLEGTLRIVDEVGGGWGHLTLDHVVVGDEPAQPRSSETTVNLVVDGEVVRSATGNNSETLDWASWDVAEFIGSEAEIMIVDNNRFGWGHILVDDIVASDAAQPRRIESYDWLDWGPDYYAAISFANVPDGRRIMMAWMNDWRYANAIPTAPWRSANALPRELTLQLVDGAYELEQAPVRELASLEVKSDRLRRTNVTVADTATALPWSSDAYKLEVTVDPQDATFAGVAVRTNSAFGDEGGEGTLIGIDTAAGRLVVDRTSAGEDSFHPQFAAAYSAPLVHEDGRQTFTVYVDRSSVEVFADGGLRTITSQIFPDPNSLGLSLVSEGGTARFVSVVATPLTPSVHTGAQAMEAEVTSAQCTAGVIVTVTNPTDERQSVRLDSVSGHRNVTLAAGQTAQVRLNGKPAKEAGSLTIEATARPSQTTSWTSVSMPACS